jgi:hypothetical protein
MLDGRFTLPKFHRLSALFGPVHVMPGLDPRISEPTLSGHEILGPSPRMTLVDFRRAPGMTRRHDPETRKATPEGIAFR